MSLNYATYLANPHVRGFIKYLSDVVNGTTPINFTVGFSRRQLYRGFEQKFPGHVDMRPGGGAVYVVVAQTLEDLFRMYWWGREDYDVNKVKLDAVRAAILLAIDGDRAEDANLRALDACHRVMAWGFREGGPQYTKNMDWAKLQGAELASVLRAGREGLTGEKPRIEVFGTKPSTSNGLTQENARAPKMNAGWTKYYALALNGHVIYDARVGAAMGFLARCYLERLAPEKESEGVPECLHFRWDAPEAGGALRNPSSPEYQFKRLQRNEPSASRTWARLNVQANWILSAAREEAHADWCSGPDGLRRLEAALFMLGYDLSRADAAKPVAVAA